MMCGKTTEEEVGPVPATMTSWVIASAIVLIPDVYQVCSTCAFETEPADPDEFADIVTDARRVENLADGGGLRDHADDSAVARRDIIEIIGGDEAARARHVLHDDCRLPGQMRAEKAREQPPVGVDSRHPVRTRSRP